MSCGTQCDAWKCWTSYKYQLLCCPSFSASFLQIVAYCARAWTTIYLVWGSKDHSICLYTN
jgi:hypothetical protein